METNNYIVIYSGETEVHEQKQVSLFGLIIQSETQLLSTHTWAKNSLITTEYSKREIISFGTYGSEEERVIENDNLYNELQEILNKI